MRALVVRHARAGDREEWRGDDRLRPLDQRGRRQAEALATTLAELGAHRLLSSPYIRCVQTLEPAAGRLALPIEERDELAEGSSAGEVLALLDELGEPLAALSTHGDVIDAVVGRPCRKGAVWVVEVRGRRVRPERYLPPN
jgi:8-oxo-dGTP diphosphatase